MGSETYSWHFYWDGLCWSLEWETRQARSLVLPSPPPCPRVAPGHQLLAAPLQFGRGSLSSFAGEPVLVQHDLSPGESARVSGWLFGDSLALRFMAHSGFSLLSNKGDVLILHTLPLVYFLFYGKLRWRRKKILK